MSVNRHKPMSRGFTMIEVLVALIVLSVGLLGLAQMQITGLRYNYGAYSRSQATLLAYDIVDRMRANLDGVNAGAYDAIDTAVPPANTLACITSSAGCSAADMATVDIYEWCQLFNAAPQLLPGASATVAVARVGTTRTFTITVNWTERDAKADGTINAALANKNLTISVQP